MAKYRKMALTEAVQFTDPAVLPDGVCVCKWSPTFHIHTLEGPLGVTLGDWIATGVNAEHWAIKPDVFAKSYELAEP